MTSRRNLFNLARLGVLATLIGTVSLACSADYGTGNPNRLASVNVTLPQPVIEVGQIITATSVALDQYNQPIAAGAVTWSSSAPLVAGVGATTGQITALGPGTATITATVGGKSGQRTITVTTSPIVINEVKPSGDATTGWVELFNPTAEEIDLGGFSISSHDFNHPFVIPALAKIAAFGYRVIDETLIPGGLSGHDAVILFSKFGVLIDDPVWLTDP